MYFGGAAVFEHVNTKGLAIAIKNRNEERRKGTEHVKLKSEQDEKAEQRRREFQTRIERSSLVDDFENFNDDGLESEDRYMDSVCQQMRTYDREA